MQRSALYSFLLHLTLILAIIFGLPELFRREFDAPPPVVTVEILPVKDITNVKPTTTQIKPEKKPEKQPEKPKPEPKKEQPKAPEPKKPTPKTKTDIAPPPPVKVKPVQKPNAPEKPKEKPEEKPKPKPPVVEKPKQEPKKEEPKEQDLDAILKSVKNLAEKSQPQETVPNAEVAKQTNRTPYDAGKPLSMSEIDAIRRQIEKNWNIPAGGRNDYELAVRLVIYLQQNGTVAKVEVVDMQRYQRDSFFRAMADSAVRAVWRSSPLRDLPADKYDRWQEIEIAFDPGQLLY